MNKPLAERIERLIGLCDDPGTEQELTLMLSDVRELIDALRDGRRAIGDHFAPNDCYATGPVTGNIARDLIECPACSFIAKYDAILRKVGGRNHNGTG